MPRFKTINYGRLLYESLRNYFAVNTAGNMSIMYKFCAACLFPLVQPFEDYDARRRVLELIAMCKWQIGQLTNVLNRLYDPLLRRIFITQATTSSLSAPQFPYITPVQTASFRDPAGAQARKFNDRLSGTNVAINVPIGTDIPSITATIEQIKISGILYTIIEY